MIGIRLSLWRVAAIAFSVMAGAHAQQAQLGNCDGYQTSSEFTQEYVQSLAAQEGGYVVALTSGGALPCQEITFYENGTFNYATFSPTGESIEYRGDYTTNATTFNSAGFINLRLPPGVFGADILGNLRLSVLIAEPDYFVVASCVSLGLFKSEQTIAFVPRVKFLNETAQEINSTLVDKEIPGSEGLQQVSQANICKQRGQYLQRLLAQIFYRLFRKFMPWAFPPLNGVTNYGAIPQLGNALGLVATVAGGGAQGFTYPYGSLFQAPVPQHQIVPQFPAIPQFQTVPQFLPVPGYVYGQQQFPRTPFPSVPSLARTGYINQPQPVPHAQPPTYSAYVERFFINPSAQPVVHAPYVPAN